MFRRLAGFFPRSGDSCWRTSSSGLAAERRNRVQSSDPGARVDAAGAPMDPLSPDNRSRQPEKDLSWLRGLHYDHDPMTRNIVRRSLLAALLLCGSGCAAQSDNSSKQLHALADQVRRLQSTADRLEERMAAIENARLRETQRTASLPVVSSEIPSLPVIKADSESSAVSGDSSPPQGETGDEPRPLIVGEGSRIETRSSGVELPATNNPTRRMKDKPSSDSVGVKRPNVARDSGKKSP